MKKNQKYAWNEKSAAEYVLMGHDGLKMCGAKDAVTQVFKLVTSQELTEDKESACEVLAIKLAMLDEKDGVENSKAWELLVNRYELVTRKEVKEEREKAMEKLKNRLEEKTKK